MDRTRFLPVALAACFLLAAGPGVSAQAADNASAHGLKVKQIPVKVVPTPFPSGSEAPGRMHAIEFIEPEKMSEKDKLLEADAESSIQERAGWAGLEFNEGKWSYRQIACPALPNHLFLQFQRSNVSGDVSLFSVSVPRSGEGRIRIVPIQRRGYSLFSPAPINALTISAFNHIRAEEQPNKPPDWLTTGLCYAALAGAHPQAVLLPDKISEQTFPAASAAMLEISQNGGAVIHFSDVNPQRAMQWSMTFNGKGRLLKASHSPAPLVTAKAVAGPTDHPKVKPIPQTIVDLNPPKPQ